MGGGHLHEAVAARLVGCALPRRHQRVVGPRERDPVDDHQLAGVTGHVEALPQRERAEQADGRVGDELRLQVRQLAVALAEDRHVREPLAQRLGGGLRSTAAREQPQRATAGGLEQAADLLDLGSAEPVATGRRQVLGDVEDRLLRVVERRADVDTPPRQRDRVVR